MEDFLTITCHNAYNYGAVLQTYALYTYLTELGYKGKVINYKNKNFYKAKTNNIIKKVIRPFVRMPDFVKGNKVFGKFLKDYIVLTDKMSNEKELKEKLPKSRVYITGSDQVWNCSPGEVGNDDNYFLSFVDGNNAKKISYAASIAMESLNEQQEKRMKKLLSDFSEISVREQTAVNILNKMGYSNVNQVIDPVYLLSIDLWKKLLKKSTLIEKLKEEKYILVYGFLRQKNVYDYAKRLAKNKHCKIYNVNTLIEDFTLNTDKYFWNVSPEDFLALIYYAEDIVTNSFHGVSFSIIFNKNFHLFGKKGNSSSRMFDLVKMLGLEKRIVSEKEGLLLTETDYNEAKQKLVIKINESKEYLKNIFQKED